jgi:hypothetical protein
VRVLTSSAISDNEFFSAAVSADGASLAFGDYDSQIWWGGVPTTNVTIPSGSSFTIDPSNYQVVEGVAYSPKNARYLAVAGGVTANSDPGTVSILDLSAKSTFATYSAVTSSPISVTFSPNGNAVVVGEGGCGRVLLCTN